MIKTTIVILYWINVAYCQFYHPIVKIPNAGIVEGYLKTTLHGRPIFAFEGVPYANPPVGEYRFREPQPVRPWTGQIKAHTKFQCLQYNHFTGVEKFQVTGDEDCLYLNIYTPSLYKEANYDVVVFIHGGAFMFGDGGGPEYLLDKDVVLVNVHYRLGPLGFLSTEDNEIPTNLGIRDQIFALKWIKENIHNFGGNASSVTLAGMSAGGASVHIHLLSPKSRGLFHKAISQSGAVANPWATMEAPLEKTKKLAASVGCDAKDTNTIVKCLRNRHGRQIVEAVVQFQPWLYNPFSPFAVIVDSWAKDPVLPDQPLNLIKAKRVYDVPWIASQTNSEGLYPGADFYPDKYLNDIDTRWNEIIPFVLDYNYTISPCLRNDVSQKIRNHFFGNQRVTKSTFMNLIQSLTERHFDIEKYAKLHSAAVKSPVRFYYFSYRGAFSNSMFTAGNNLDFGAAHGDDYSYIFKTRLNVTSTNRDKEMVHIFVDLFSSFAKYGKPQLSIIWPEVSKNANNSLTYLAIKSPEQLENATGNIMKQRNRLFWESLPFKENEHLNNKTNTLNY